MAIFTKSGDSENDFWLVDNCFYFATFKANAIPMFDRDLPIRLHVGNFSYGQIHTEKHWTPKTAGNRSVPELIHYKLGQSGNTFNAEKEKKITISMVGIPYGYFGNGVSPSKVR